MDSWTAARLRGLGFGVERVAGGWRVQVPGWRNDVGREIDLLEELARHRGLAAFPNALPAASGAGILSPSQKAERLVRRTLTGAGLDEAINYAFSPTSGPTLAAEGTALRLANPLSEEQGLLRSSLVVPGLLRNLQTNLRQGRREVRLFELARVFLPGQPKPLEEQRLGMLLAGPWQPHWSAKFRIESRRGMALTGFAGPLSNLIVAALLGILVRLDVVAWHSPWQYEPFYYWDASWIAADIVGYVILLNLVLAVFNLIPIAPLDGFNVAVGILPRRQAYAWARLERYGPLICLC